MLFYQIGGLQTVLLFSVLVALGCLCVCVCMCVCVCVCVCVYVCTQTHMYIT